MNEKFLVILFYYNRPQLVKYGLNSLKEQTYQNWEVAFIDDGSETLGAPIVKEIFGDSPKFKLIQTGDTVETKMKRNGINGSLMGKFANEAIAASDADYVIMLCDDDALYPDYLQNLMGWFEKNPDKNYVYSHIKQYNPNIQVPKEPLDSPPHSLNKTDTICPYYALDMSQIAFRRRPAVEQGVQFPYPYTVNLDAEMFLLMHKYWGNASFSGFIGQFKAIYTDNLSHRMGQVLGGFKDNAHVFKIELK